MFKRNRLKTVRVVAYTRCREGKTEYVQRHLRSLPRR